MSKSNICRTVFKNQSNNSSRGLFSSVPATNQSHQMFTQNPLSTSNNKIMFGIGNRNLGLK
jgi:hypothetical protein